jgi:hypothetical protein
VVAEIGQLAVHQRPGRSGHQHLASVPNRRDSRRAMHVHPDVALVGEVRRTRMHAHPHTNRAACQPLRRCRGRRKGPRCRRESDEERIPLRVHLHATLRGERLPQQPTMVRQRICVPFRTKLMQELCRALHVREEECHCSRRKIAHVADHPTCSVFGLVPRAGAPRQRPNPSPETWPGYGLWNLCPHRVTGSSAE